MLSLPFITPIVFESQSASLLGTVCVVTFSLVLSWLNYLGLNIMGWPLGGGFNAALLVDSDQTILVGEINNDPG